jgi:hypothetical protein
MQAAPRSFLACVANSAPRVVQTTGLSRREHTSISPGNQVGDWLQIHTHQQQAVHLSAKSQSRYVGSADRLIGQETIQKLQDTLADLHRGLLVVIRWQTRDSRGVDCRSDGEWPE